MRRRIKHRRIDRLHLDQLRRHRHTMVALGRVTDRRRRVVRGPVSLI
ncbi:MAG: hypothetical protein ACE5GB_11150 [Acidimicrobiales bacterium]